MTPEEKRAYDKRWRAKHREQHATNVKHCQSAESASVYEIVNSLSGKKYIGSTTMNPKARWYKYVSYSKIKKHRPLYADMNKYGIGSFKFEVLFTCPKDQARKAEQFIIDAYGGELYNKNRATRR